MEIKKEDILNFLPKSTSLIYVDRNDDLKNNLKLVQDCIQQNSWDMINEHIESWYLDHAQDSIDFILKELKIDLSKHYEITNKKSKKIIKNNYDFIVDEIYNRCNDTIALDLLRNTRKESIYYDTGYEVPSDSWQWNQRQINKEIKSILKVLKIKELSPKQQIVMENLVQQASYGGQLVIYFMPDWESLITEKEPTSVKFSNFHLGIINTGNGSGDAQYFGDLQCEIPFKRENLIIDKLDKYSFVYEVCGMVHNWCSETKFEFGNRFKNSKVAKSQSVIEQENQAELDTIFNSGKCTFGDMNITRHRNAVYVNDYPCGNRCTDCGTFWID